MRVLRGGGGRKEEEERRRKWRIKGARRRIRKVRNKEEKEVETED